MNKNKVDSEIFSEDTLNHALKIATFSDFFTRTFGRNKFFRILGALVWGLASLLGMGGDKILISGQILGTNVGQSFIKFEIPKYHTDRDLRC